MTGRSDPARGSTGPRGTASAGLTGGMSAVVFDFFGTLTPVPPEEVWAASAARIAAALGVSGDALHAALDSSFGERITGALGGVRQTLQAMAGRLGCQPTPAQLDAASRVRRDSQEALFTLRPEALGVIRALRAAGMRVGLVSDCTCELPDAWPRLPLAELVDAPVFSCSEGRRKPDPALFAAVTGRLGTAPRQCLYVGDGGGSELPGATAAGLRAVLLAGPDWVAAGRDDLGWNGPRIASLAELCGPPAQ